MKIIGDDEEFFFIDGYWEDHRFAKLLILLQNKQLFPVYFLNENDSERHHILSISDLEGTVLFKFYLQKKFQEGCVWPENEFLSYYCLKFRDFNKIKSFDLNNPSPIENTENNINTLYRLFVKKTNMNKLLEEDPKVDKKLLDKKKLKKAGEKPKKEKAKAQKINEPK